MLSFSSFDCTYNFHKNKHIVNIFFQLKRQALRNLTTKYVCIFINKKRYKQWKKHWKSNGKRKSGLLDYCAIPKKRLRVKGLLIKRNRLVQYRSIGNMEKSFIIKGNKTMNC